ncbi:sensor histidine kinase [Amycolatopsis sp. VS8301801F10]|uniref:sensor histidine kinase n=1 Tax=Amycolatopsis sp. VS8301801F10 TaxID=2652442 RepID=UPI0038FC09C8
MGIEGDLREEFDRWERAQTATFTALPYVLLAVSVSITLLQLPAHLPVVLGLSGAAALWLRCFPLRALRAGYYAGFLAITAGLAALAPWYGLFAFAGYPLAFQYLTGRWRYAGAAATAMVSAVAFLGGTAKIDAENLWWVWLGVSVLSIAVAWAVCYFVEMAYQRNELQKQALAELHEVNLELEAALAENAALHVRLLARAREAGVLDERQRMAREIHDTLAQGLAGILTQLQAAEHTAAEPAVLGRHLANATELARESLVEARRTVQSVEPAVLAEARLPEAIGEVARKWSAANGIAAVLTTTGDARPMHTDVEVALLRTAQEALSNVAKHARARRVGLTLSYMPDLVTLDVRDDGVGFEPNAKRANGSTNGGFGLAGMRQRVQRFAGRLDVESEPGRGTAISAAVPAIPAGGAR